MDDRFKYHHFENGSLQSSKTITNQSLPNKNGYVLSKNQCPRTNNRETNNEFYSTVPQYNLRSRNLTKIDDIKKKTTEWQKVLYKHQGVPDNFVPPTFLKDLRKNVNLRRFHLMEVIIAASYVTQQFILIVILIMMFIYFDCYENRYDPVLFTIVTIVTLFLYSIILTSYKFQKLIQVKSCLIFLIACFTTSPVLKTLTATISTDTIYAQCTLMTIIHLAFHDYGLNSSIVFRPISINAIFFASVCLASRLSTSYHAFAFLIFSIDLFVLIGLMYKSLSRNKRLIFTAIFTLITLALVQITFGLICLIASIIFLFCINIVCPFIFIKMQSMKENIYGPWDEAIIDQSKLKFTNPTKTSFPTNKPSQNTNNKFVGAKRIQLSESSDSSLPTSSFQPSLPLPFLSNYTNNNFHYSL